ncbi:golgin subfamily B member 1-like [Senna tora]|uniref:Golgin subfamily B member 1-like n=1 Tax=Senna tora TaxID=362788 RepID=A0A834SIU1_9FABA|nr:golgin subfamily B member 1-like [Senna tora]
MFRLHKHRSSKSEDKFEFKFSHFQAFQVPKGWDKLFVSIISKENGKTIAKSSKALVRNGSCQWADIFSQSILVSRDNSSKEMEHCLLKLLVATGSSRSGILGEATINMTSYTSSTDAIPLTIPLNKCNHGTSLHKQRKHTFLVTIQCLTPKTKFRDQESGDDLNANKRDVSIKSNGSDCSNVQSVESSSVKDLDSISSFGEFESRGTNFSGSGSHCSFNSAEGSIGRENLSRSIDSRDDGQSPGGRQDSTSSLHSVSDCSYPAQNFSQQTHSSVDSQVTNSGNNSCQQEFGALSDCMTNSSKSRLEAAEDSTEELRAEAKMWEMNARKLMVDLDMLRTEFSGQSKNLEDMEKELSVAHLERDNLKKEIEQLKLSLEYPSVNQKALEVLSQGECVSETKKALEDEFKFQKESNANLSLQLKRSQEANIELVSVLQELEETIEQQKIEIENLSELTSQFSDMENSLQLSIERNRTLMLQLEQMEESKNNLLVKVQQLELALEEKRHDIETAKCSDRKTLSDIEVEYESKLSAKEEEILSLKTKLFQSLPEKCNAETVSRNLGDDDADLIREIEVLKEKLQELETDCNELTDENLELLFKLKEAQKESRNRGASEDFSPNKLEDQDFSSFESDVNNKVFPSLHLEDVLQRNVIGKVKSNDHISVKELESLKLVLEGRITELNKKVIDKTSEIENLEVNLSSKEKEIGVLRKCQTELQEKVSHLQNDKIQRQEQVAVMLKERDINLKCLCDLRNDLATLSRSMHSQVSAKEKFQRKSSELENGKHELELLISETNQEKEHLAMCMSVLEAQLRDLTNKQDSILSELESSKSQVAMLQEENMKIKSGMDLSKEDMKKRLNATLFQWSEAQQECEYLKRENQKLQVAVENLAEECNSLQKLNGDLIKQKLELQEHCSIAGTKLRQSDQRFAECSERVQLLEKNFAVMLEDNTSKEKSIASELDVLLTENRIHMEQGQSLLNQMHLEKTVEIQNLQQVIEHLSMKLSATHDEKERIASNALLEVSELCAEKAKLEAAFREVQSEVLASKNDINIMQTEYEKKLQDLTTELAAFKINQEMLMANHEKFLKLVEDYKSRELKVKSTMNALESKLEVTESDRQQFMEETKILRIQLQQIDQFKIEIEALKNDLNSANSEKERLEASLRVTSELCENLKAEKKFFAVKILAMEKDVSELEDCKRSRTALEERLAQTEIDLKTKETLVALGTEHKNELGNIKRINRQYQQSMQVLEQEKNEFQEKFQALEEELKLIKEQKRNQVSKINRKALPVHEDSKILKHTPVVKNSSQHRCNRKKLSSKNDKETVKNQQDLYSSKHQSEVETQYGLLDESVHVVEVDPESKVQLLETELAKAKAANNMLLSQLQNNQANAPMKSMGGGELVTKENFERTKSMLEAELRDIQERYLHMSLKYAEVEAQREELVMKLKVTKMKMATLKS